MCGVNGYLRSSGRRWVAAAGMLTVLASALTPAAVASEGQSAATGGVAVAGTRLAPKPKLVLKRSKRVLVVTTKKRGVLRIVIRTSDGNRTKRRVVANRRKTRIALPVQVVRVKVRTVGPRSGWAKLRFAPQTGTPGNPGNPGTPGNPGDQGEPGEPRWDAPPVTYTYDLNEMLQRLNAFRATGLQCGPIWEGPTHPVVLDPDLTRAAQAMADDMIARHWFGHSSPEHWGVREWVASVAPGYTGFPGFLADNLSIGHASASVASHANGWAASPGHCATLMNTNSNRVGLAYAIGPSPAAYQAGITDPNVIPDGIVWIALYGRV